MREKAGGVFAIALVSEVALLGYGAYPFIDRRGSSLLLIPAVIVILVSCVLLRRGWLTRIVLVVSIAVSLAAAVAVARGIETIAAFFSPGLFVMYGIARVVRMPREYDPVGHPLLWGVGIVVNAVVVAAALGTIVLGITSVSRKRTASSN
jgi:hypothetical protein